MRNICPPRGRRGQHARVSIGVALALLGAGSALSCGRDTPGPLDPPVVRLTTLEVTPTAAELCAPGPGNTVQLTIVARDQNGAEIPSSVGIATYSSSAPEIAGVSGSGVVAAAAPGTAVITATFTLDGITRTASINATIHDGTGGYPEIAGVYDLTALWTVSQWGMQGTRETAVITIEHSGDTPLFVGTFADFRFDYGSYADGPYSGSVIGSFDCVGRVVLELRREGQQESMWDGRGTVNSKQIVGDFSHGSGEGGTFTAERRQAE